MKKRLFALLLSMVLIFGFIPTITFATGMDMEVALIETESDEETESSCTVTENCTLAVGHEGECVVNETEDNEGEIDPASETEMEAVENVENNCTVTEGCTLETGHEGDCVVNESAESEEDDAAEEEVTFVSVQTMIDALPDAEDISEENMSDVEAQLDAINDAKSALYQAGGDVDSLDMARYDAACEALATLNESDETGTLLLGSMPSLTATRTALTSTGGSLSSGDYYLADNLTLTNNIVIPSGNTVTIDLNGYTLTGNGSGSVIYVHGTLTLKDSSSGKTGIVTGGTGSNGRYGGGVYVSGNGSFTMSGGTILNNSANDYGGGVYVNGGSFTMSGGTISGNSAYSGGGVFVNSGGSFTMSGGTISNNSASQLGGGVYVWSNSFTMNGGTISSNTATFYGGGVYVHGYQTFSVSGSPVISDNTNENVFLPSDAYITLSGQLTKGASIGVTTATTPTSSSAVQITTIESSTNYYSSAVNYIFSDNSNYIVKVNSAGYLQWQHAGNIPIINIDNSASKNLSYRFTL